YAQKNKLENIKFTHIKFGFANYEVNIEVVNELNEEVIQISKNIITKLNIPVFTNLQVKVKNNQLEIGPLIGVLLGRKSSLVYKKLTMLQSFTRYYDQVNGIIVGFTLDDMDEKNLTVDGIVYNPQQDVWERMTVPYPGSIFKRGPVQQKEREYLFSLYGEKFFNYKKIDKWEIHKRLSQFSEISTYIPEAVLYSDKTSLIKFLNKHKNIFVKPVAGNQGLGIYNVVQDTSCVKVFTRKDHENICYEYKNEEEFKGFMDEFLKTEGFIMQQTLNLVVKDRTLDFRVGMDKDKNGKWKHNMFVTRVGGDESIVSNVASGGGYILNPKEALKIVYDFKDEELVEQEKELLDIAYNMANKLDLTGVPLGKIALDLAITKEKQIYLIEINNTTPNDNIMKLVDDYEKKFLIRNENILYGRFLAGFNDGEQTIFFTPETNRKKIKYTLFVKAKRKEKEEVIKKLSTLFLNENMPENKVVEGINIRVHFEATR